MKTSVWDILTGVVLLGVLCVIGVVVLIIMNPSTALNPFPPAPVSPAVATRIVLPSATNTVPGLPPTWTFTPTPEDTKAPVNADGLRPSSTPIPTNTVLVLPSFTPSKTARAAGVGGGACTISYQDPPDNKVITKGSTFDMRWTIKNSSNTTWRADSVDILFVSGDRLHNGNDARDMPYDITPGGMLDLVVPMTAPATPGAYVSNWRLSQGSKTVCNFFVSIRVQ